MKASDAGMLDGAGSKVVTPEQMGLSRLRTENVRLKRECEMLKKRRRTSQEMCSEVRLAGWADAGTDTSDPCRIQRRVWFGNCGHGVIRRVRSVWDD